MSLLGSENALFRRPGSHLVAESDSEVNVVRRALYDASIGCVGKCTGTVRASAVESDSVASSITSVVPEAAGDGKGVRRNEGDVRRRKMGVLKSSFNECTPLAVQSAVSCLKVCDERVKLSVDSVGRACGEDIPILHKSGRSSTTVVGERHSVLLSQNRDGKQGGSGEEGFVEEHSDSYELIHGYES